MIPSNILRTRLGGSAVVNDLIILCGRRRSPLSGRQLAQDQPLIPTVTGIGLLKIDISIVGLGGHGNRLALG